MPKHVFLSKNNNTNDEDSVDFEKLIKEIFLEKKISIRDPNLFFSKIIFIGANWSSIELQQVWINSFSTHFNFFHEIWTRKFLHQSWMKIH